MKYISAKRKFCKNSQGDYFVGPGKGETTLKDPKRPNQALADLLGRLESKAIDGYGRMSFQGRALGKTDENLHVAVETGIVAIPLAEIEGIRQIAGRSATEIWIDVKNGDRITQLRRVPDIAHIERPVWPGTYPDPGPLVWPGKGGIPDTGVPHTGAASSSTGGCDGIDTTCASGGVADQTDDYRQSCWHDTD